MSDPEHDEASHEDGEHNGDGHHEETWGAYNAEPPTPSPLPPISPRALAFFGFVLFAFLGAVVYQSFKVDRSSGEAGHAHSSGHEDLDGHGASKGNKEHADHHGSDKHHEHK